MSLDGLAIEAASAPLRRHMAARTRMAALPPTIRPKSRAEGYAVQARVVPGEIVVDEERLRDDGPTEARPPDQDASTGREHATATGPAGTEVNLVDPGRHADPAVSRRGTEGNPLDTGRNPDTAGSRCGSGGLRDRLRERLAQAQDAGATAVAYQPAGPDIARELDAFMTMTRG